jgi:hypothetical protein
MEAGIHVEYESEGAPPIVPSPSTAEKRAEQTALDLKAPAMDPGADVKNGTADSTVSPIEPKPEQTAVEAPADSPKEPKAP